MSKKDDVILVANQASTELGNKIGRTTVDAIY